MKENAIIVRPLDIIKVYVDFSNIDNVYRSINADLVSTIHTVQTQEISEKLGFHISCGIALLYFCIKWSNK